MSTPAANPLTPSAFSATFNPASPQKATENVHLSGGNPLPTSLYASLLGKLVTILELDPTTVTSTHQGRQELLKATNDYKFSLAHAKDLATRLPGGELKLEEQDAILEMLEAVRKGKREQLVQFATQVESYQTAQSAIPARMRGNFEDVDMDSAASTPAS